MQKKELLLCFCLVVVFIICVLSFWSYKNHEAAKTGRLHVFIDSSVNGALLQMVELVNLPDKEAKIIAWDQFENINNRLSLSKYSAREIDCKPEDILFEVKQELRKHPNYKVIFYTSIGNAGVLLFPVLKEIPPKNVMHIHLFEENHGALAFDKEDNYLSHSYEFDNCPEEEIIPTYAFYTHLRYKTTYHLGFITYMKERPEFQNLMTLLRHADIRQVDFDKMVKFLTPAQKMHIAKLIGLNSNDCTSYLLGQSKMTLE